MNLPQRCFVLNPVGLGLSYFHFYLFLCIFWFFLFLPWCVGYSEAYCLASICLWFYSFFFPVSWYIILLHFDQKRCLKWFQCSFVFSFLSFFFFFNLTRLDLWPTMWCILEIALSALEKKVKSIVFWLKCPVDIY